MHIPSVDDSCMGERLLCTCAAGNEDFSDILVFQFNKTADICSTDMFMC